MYYWCMVFCLYVYCLFEFTFFCRTEHRRIRLVKPSTCCWVSADKFDSRLHSIHTLAKKQHWLKSARVKVTWEELDQRIIDTAVRQWRTIVSPSCVCQGKRRPLWAQSTMAKRWKLPDKLFNRSILTVGYITINASIAICDRVELVTHCF